MNRPKIILAAIFLTLALPLAVEAAQPSLRKVYATIPAISESSLAFYIARDKGYWREEGLDVELILARAAPSIQAVIAGNVEFGTAGGSALLPITRGLPMTFLFASYDRANFSLYSNPKIRSVQELKGKRIGVSSFGSGPDSLLRDFLNDHGVEAGRDATILAVGTGMERFLSLKSGAVDAAMLSPSAYIMAEDAGYRELVGFVRQASYVYLQGGIIVRNDLLKNEPALVEKFVRGSLKGLLYAQANRQPTVALLTRVLKVTQDVAVRTYDEVRPGITQDGTVGESQQKKALTAFLEKNKEPPPLGKIFDFSLTRKAAADLKAQQWRPTP